MANKKPIKKKKFSGLAKKTKFNPKHKKTKKKISNNNKVKSAFIKNVFKSSANLTAAILTGLTPEIENFINETKESKDSLVDKYGDAFKAGKEGKGKLLSKVLENENVKNLKSDVKSGLTNTIKDLKSGNIFGNKKAIDDAITKGMFGDDFDMDDVFGDDDFEFSDEEESDGYFEDSDDDFNSYVEDNSSSVKNNIYVANGVSNSVLGNMSAALIGSITSIKEDLVSITTASTEKSDNLIEIQTNIKDNVEGIYKIIEESFGQNKIKKENNSLLEYFMTDGVLNPFKGITSILTGKAKLNGTDGGIFGMLNKDMIDLMLPMVRATIQQPLFSLSKLLITNLLPLSINSFAESMQKSLKNYSTKLVYNFAKGKTGFGKMLSNLLGLNFFNQEEKAEVYSKRAVPFDGKVYKSITEVIPHYLARILSGVNALGKRFGAQSKKDDDELFDWKNGYLSTRKTLLDNYDRENRYNTGRIYYNVISTLNSNLNSEEEAKKVLTKEEFNTYKQYMALQDSNNKKGLDSLVGLDKIKQKKISEDFEKIQRKLLRSEELNPKSTTNILSRITKKFGYNFDIDEALENSKGDKDAINLLTRIKTNPEAYHMYKESIVNGSSNNFNIDEDYKYGDLYDRRLYKKSEFDEDKVYGERYEGPSLGSKLESYWSGGIKSGFKEGAIKKSAHAFSTELSKIFFDNPNQGFFKSLKDSVKGSIDNWITTSEYAPEWLRNKVLDKSISPEVEAIDSVKSALDDMKNINQQVVTNTAEVSNSVDSIKENSANSTKAVVDLHKAATTNSTIYSHDTHIESKFDKFADGFFKIIGDITGRKYNPDLGTFTINPSKTSKKKNEDDDIEVKENAPVLDKVLNKVNKVIGKTKNSKRIKFRNFVRNKILKGKYFENTTEDQKAEMYERYLALGYKKLEKGLFSSEQDVIDYAEAEVAKREITKDSSLTAVISRGLKSKLNNIYRKIVVGKDKIKNFDDVDGIIDITLRRLEISVIKPLKNLLIGKDVDKLSEKDSFLKILSNKFDKKIIVPLADKLMKVNDGTGKSKIKDRWDRFLKARGVDLKKLGLSGFTGGFLGTFLGHPLLGAAASMIITTDAFKDSILNKNNPVSVINLIKRAFIGKHADILNINNSLFDIIKFRLKEDILEPFKVRLFNGNKKQKSIFQEIGQNIVLWMDKNKISEKLQDSFLIISKEIKFRVKNFFYNIGNLAIKTIKKIGNVSRNLLGNFIKTIILGQSKKKKKNKFLSWIGSKIADGFKNKIGNLMSLPFNAINKVKERFKQAGLNRYYIGTDENGNPIYDTIRMRNDGMEHLDPNDPRNKFRANFKTMSSNRRKARMAGMKGIVNEKLYDIYKDANKNPDKYIIDEDGKVKLDDNGNPLINLSYKPKDITPGEDLIVDTMKSVNHAVIEELRKGTRSIIQAFTGKSDAEMTAGELLNEQELKEYNDIGKFSGFKTSTDEKRYYELLKKKNLAESSSISYTDKAMESLKKSKDPRSVAQLAILEELKKISGHTENIDEKVTEKKIEFSKEEQDELSKLENIRSTEWENIQRKRQNILDYAKEKNKKTKNESFLNFNTEEEAYATFMRDPKSLAIVNDMRNSPNNGGIQQFVVDAAIRATNDKKDGIDRSTTALAVAETEGARRSKKLFNYGYDIKKLEKNDPEFLKELVRRGNVNFDSLNIDEKNTYIDYQKRLKKKENKDFKFQEKQDELQRSLNRKELHALTKSEEKRLRKLFKEVYNEEYNEKDFKMQRRFANEDLYNEERSNYLNNYANSVIANNYAKKEESKSTALVVYDPEAAKMNSSIAKNTSQSIIELEERRRQAKEEERNNRIVEGIETTANNTKSLNLLDSIAEKFKLFKLLFGFVKGIFNFGKTAISKVAGLFGFDIPDIANTAKNKVKSTINKGINTLLYGKDYVQALEDLRKVRDMDLSDGNPDANKNFVSGMMALRRQSNKGIVGFVNTKARKLINKVKDKIDILNDYEKEELRQVVNKNLDEKGITDESLRSIEYIKALRYARKNKAKNIISESAIGQKALAAKEAIEKKVTEKINALKLSWEMKRQAIKTARTTKTEATIGTIEVASATKNETIKSKGTLLRESIAKKWSTFKNTVGNVLHVIGSGAKAIFNAIPFPFNLIAAAGLTTGVVASVVTLIKKVKKMKNPPTDTSSITSDSGIFGNIKNITNTNSSIKEKEIDPIKVQENNDKPIFEEGKKQLKATLSSNDKKSVYDDYYSRLSSDKYKKKLTNVYNSSVNAVKIKKFLSKEASIATAIVNPAFGIGMQAVTAFTDKKYYTEFKNKVKDIKDVTEINNLKNDYKSSVGSIIWRSAINKVADTAIKAARKGITYGEYTSEIETDKKLLKEAKKAMNKTNTQNELKEVYREYLSQISTLDYKSKLNKYYNNSKTGMKFSTGLKTVLSIINPISGFTGTLFTDNKYATEFKNKVKDLKDVVEINTLKNDYLRNTVNPIHRERIRKTAKDAIKAAMNGESLTSIDNKEQADKQNYDLAKKLMNESSNEKEIKNIYNEYIGKLLTDKYKKKLKSVYDNKFKFLGRTVRRIKSFFTGIKNSIDDRSIFNDAKQMFKDTDNGNIRKNIYEQSLNQIQTDKYKDKLLKEYQKYDKPANTNSFFNKVNKILGNSPEGEKNILNEAIKKINNIKEKSELNDIWKEYKDRLSIINKTKLAAQITKANLKNNKNVSLGDEVKKVFKNFFNKFKKNPFGTLVQLITGKLDLTNSSVPSTSSTSSILEKNKNSFSKMFENISNKVSGWFNNNGNNNSEKESSSNTINPTSYNSKQSNNIGINGVSIVKSNSNKSNGKSSITVVPVSSGNTVSISGKTFDTESFDLSNSISSYNSNDAILMYLATIASNTSNQNNNLDNILYTLTQLYNVEYNISNDKLSTIIKSLGGKINSNGTSSVSNETSGTATSKGSSVNVTGSNKSLHDITTDMTYNKMMEAIANNRKSITNNQSQSQANFGMNESTALIAMGI